jgi:hypothetical protein
MALTLKRRKKTNPVMRAPEGGANLGNVSRGRQLVVPALAAMLAISVIAGRIEARRDLHERVLSHPLA